MSNVRPARAAWWPRTFGADLAQACRILGGLAGSSPLAFGLLLGVLASWVC